MKEVIFSVLEERIDSSDIVGTLEGLAEDIAGDIATRLDRMMQIMWDAGLDVSYIKDTGKWHWHPRLYDDFSDPEFHGPHDTFLQALDDAVEPYEEEEEENA